MNECEWKKTKIIGIVFIISLSTIIGYILFKNRKSETFQEKTKLIYMYMNGCGWCNKFNPTWDKLKLIKMNIALEKIERRDKPKKYNDYVRGYPTILLDKGDVIIV